MLNQEKNSKMKACQKRIQEVDTSLKSFIESISERMFKTEKKLETICDRIERLESLSSVNTGEFTEMEITNDSVDEIELSQEQKVN